MSVTFYVVKDGQIIENLVEREFGPENELELNVSNSNARMLLDLLGVKVGDEGLTGEIAKLAKFEATCMDPLQILRAAPFLDAGRRDRVYRGANSATVIELAPRDGYLTDRVAKLRELAQFALLNGGKLVRMSQEPKAGGFGNIRCPHSRNQSKGLMPEANGSTRNVWMS